MNYIFILIAFFHVGCISSEQTEVVSEEPSSLIWKSAIADINSMTGATLLQSLRKFEGMLNYSLVNGEQPLVLAGRILPDAFSAQHDPGFIVNPQSAVENMRLGHLLCNNSNTYANEVYAFQIIHKMADKLPLAFIDFLLECGNKLPPSTFDVILFITMDDIANDSRIDIEFKNDNTNLLKLSKSSNPIYRLLAFQRFGNDLSNENCNAVAIAALSEGNSVFQYLGILKLLELHTGTAAIENLKKSKYTENDGTIDSDLKISDVIERALRINGNRPESPVPSSK